MDVMTVKCVGDMGMGEVTRKLHDESHKSLKLLGKDSDEICNTYYFDVYNRIVCDFAGRFSDVLWESAFRNCRQVVFLAVKFLIIRLKKCTPTSMQLLRKYC